jgi:hypothetical protein
MADNTFESRSEDVLEALVAGVSSETQPDSTGSPRGPSTAVLARGRRDPGSKYGPFAEAVDRSRADRELPAFANRPAARAGSPRIQTRK